MAPHVHDALHPHGHGGHDEDFGPEAPSSASFVHRWDPRMKLIALGAFIACLACLSTATGAALGLAGSVLLLASARIRPGMAARRFAEVSAFLAPFLLLLPLFGKGPLLFNYGFLAIHADGAAYAGMLLFKALAIVSVTLALFETAPLADTFWALQSLGAPRQMIQMALITHRYLPLLSDEKDALFTAASCRGFRPTSGWRGFETIAWLAGAVLTRGFWRAERVWQSMSCRGFRGTLYPTKQWSMGALDYAISASVIAASILLLAWDQLP